MREGMYLDGSGRGGERDEGPGSLVAHGQGGGVEEVVDAANEAGPLHGISVTHLGINNGILQLKHTTSNETSVGVG